MNTQSERTGYFVDPETAEEAERLRIQGRYLDKMMGLLPPQIPSLDLFRDASLLDVGCSSGGWACEIASQYPYLHVTGIDISENMIRAARARAYANKIHERAHFDTMDARVYPLTFPDASFQVIHARLIFAFMTQQLWPCFVQECFRLLRPGGYLIVTENDAQCWTTSPALAEMYRLGHLALYKNHNSWSQEYVGIVVRLPGLMKRHGFQVLSQHSHRIDIGPETEAYRLGVKDHKSIYRDLQPFYVRLGVATQEQLDRLYQQMNEEMAANDFNAYWLFTRVTGRKPEEN